jgi:hypothetical protein
MLEDFFHSEKHKLFSQKYIHSENDSNVNNFEMFNMKHVSKINIKS